MKTMKAGVLVNGTHLLSERVDHVDTVALGVWLRRGSRDEERHENGMFHFIEHTLFKGTPDYNARRIAEIMDGMGGVLDAYTSKEETCYSFKVPARHLPRALEILVDMLTRPVFDEEELERERMVVLEEIKMEEDNPEDLVYERNLQAFWDGHPLGRPILGTPETVSSFTRDQLRAFHRRFYHPGDLVIAAAGKVDHHDLETRINALFPVDHGEAPAGNGATPPMPHAFQRYYPTSHHEQVNFCISFSGSSHTDPDRHAFYLLSALLGGSMSSRLFQKIREDRGLVYHIGTFLNSYRDGGVFTIYGGCSPANFDQVVELTFSEIRDCVSNGISREELDRAREHYIGSSLMSLEATQARAAAMAKSLIYRGQHFNLEAGIAALEEVSVGDVQRVAAEHLTDNTLGLCAIGRFSSDRPATPWTLSKSVDA
jgi:predicted Zn-dependent peptidase